MSTPRFVDCRCSHGRDDHDGEMRPQCHAKGCQCLQYRPKTAPDRLPPSPAASARPPLTGTAAAPDLRLCTTCGKAKPRSEFYVKGDGQTQPKCKDCDNTRPRTRTVSRVMRVRARHRAVAELIKRHEAEFRGLLDRFTTEAHDEAERLAEAARERAVESPTQHRHHEPAKPRDNSRATPGRPRQPTAVPLRPGPRREGQSVEDRIDVARCPQCIGYHDRGHACASCGTQPQAKAG